MRKRFTKITALALATVMVASSFVGCGSTEEAATTETATEEVATTEEATEEAAPVEEVTLRWVTCSGGGEQQDADMVTEAFNEMLQEILPGVTVEIDRWLTSEYVEKFDLAMAAGEVIDLAWKSYGMNTAEYYAKGTFLDINDYVDADVLADIPEFLIACATVDGELTYLPKIEMHHWTEGMFTSQSAYEAYFPVEDYEAAMEDYYANYDTRQYTEAMYDVLETYMANADAAGDLGSGYSPMMSCMYKGISLVADGTYGVFPTVLETPASSDDAWSTDLVNVYALEETEAWYAKLAEWKDLGYIRNDLLGMDNMRIYENTNEDGNLIWYHNYVNTDDPTATGVYENVVNTAWAEEYAVVPFSMPVVSSGSSDGLCIPYTSSNPEVAMDVIELMFTEEGKELKRLITFGIEGVHHTIETIDGAEYAIFADDAGYQEDDTYGMAVWIFGNTHTSYLTTGQAANQYEAYGEMIDASLVCPILGFNLDLTEYDAEITAIRSCVDEYTCSFITGDYTPEKYAEFLAKLESLGVNELMAAFQEQIDAEF